MHCRGSLRSHSSRRRGAWRARQAAARPRRRSSSSRSSPTTPASSGRSPRPASTSTRRKAGSGRHQDAAQRHDRRAEPDPREPGQPGLRRHRGQRDRAQRPGAGAQQGGGEDQPHHLRLRRAQSPTACSTSAPTTTRPARCWAARSSSCCRTAARWRSSSARSRPTTPRSASRESRTRSRGHNIEIVDKREDNTDRAKARSNVEDIINAHHDLNLVAGLWSYNGPAIAAALEALGKKGKVLAAVFDEEDGTLAGIADGTIQVTVVQKPFLFGYLSSKWMHELATKGEAAKAAIPAEQGHRHRRRGHQQGQRRRLQKQARRDERSNRARSASLEPQRPAAARDAAGSPSASPA